MVARDPDGNGTHPESRNHQGHEVTAEPRDPPADSERTERRRRQDRILILGAGLASLGLYVVLAAAGDLRAHLQLYLAIHLGLFLIYGLVAVRLIRIGTHGPRTARAGAGGEGAQPEVESVASLGSDLRIVREGRGLRSPAAIPRGWLLVGLFAAAFRLVLVVAPPSLSDDIQRYVWDGRVQASGVNPYRFAPDSAELTPLRGARDAGINHPSIRTIYPPLAEGVFFAAASAGLGERGFKAIFVLADLGVCLALAGLLARRGLPASLAVLYAWNPLVVAEVASSGHSDSVGLLLLLLAALFLVGERRSAAVTAYAGAILARLLPLGFIVILVRRLQLRYLLLGAAVLVVGYAPYASAGSSLFAGLHAYAENWDYNSVVFPAVRSVFEAVAPTDALAQSLVRVKEILGQPAWAPLLDSLIWPASLARLFLLFVFLAGTFVISADVIELDRELFLATGLLLVLSPTLCPWYLLWIVPWAALERSWPWLLFTGLAPLSYLSLRTTDGQVPSWVLAVEWGLPLGLAIVLRVRRRAAMLRSRTVKAAR